LIDDLKEIKIQSCLLKDEQSQLHQMPDLGSDHLLQSHVESGLKTQSISDLSFGESHSLLLFICCIETHPSILLFRQMHKLSSKQLRMFCYGPLRMAPRLFQPQCRQLEIECHLFLFQIFCHFHPYSHMPLSGNL